MPRGSRPGERRGGRQRGTPNKKTLIKNAVFLAAASDGERSPLDFMLALMRNPQVPLDLRIDMAAAAVPLVHARPRASRRSRPHPMEMRARRWRPAVPSGEESAVANRAKSETNLAVAVQEGRGSGDSDPLDFLLGVMRDPGTAPRQRVRAARVAARYKHSPPERPVNLVEDEFGFKIDPAMAKAVWEIRTQCGDTLAGVDASNSSPTDIEKTDGLLARLHEYIETIDCPDDYGEVDLNNDEKRVAELQARRRTEVKPTPDEDAEETYLVARSEVYRATPKHQAWRRIFELEKYRTLGYSLTTTEFSDLEKLRAQFPTLDQQLAGIDWTNGDTGLGFQVAEKLREARERGIECDREQAKAAVIEEVRQENLARKRKTSDVRLVNPDMKWPMWRIAELEERFVVGETPLAAGEEGELNDLRGRYPEIAAKVDKLDHLSRYRSRRLTEIGEKTGSHWLDVVRADEAASRAGLSFLDALRAVEDKCLQLRNKQGGTGAPEDLRFR
jgi:hypothetical protein